MIAAEGPREVRVTRRRTVVDVYMPVLEVSKPRWVSWSAWYSMTI